MTIEVTVTGLGSMESVEEVLDYAGYVDGERFKLYRAPKLEAAPSAEFGGIIRVEDEGGKGIEVGRVSMTTGTWPNPILHLSTFNTPPALLAEVLRLAVDDKYRWAKRRQVLDAEYEAKKAAK